VLFTKTDEDHAKEVNISIQAHHKEHEAVQKSCFELLNIDQADRNDQLIEVLQKVMLRHNVQT
jgi:hemerythrin